MNRPESPATNLVGLDRSNSQRRTTSREGSWNLSSHLSNGAETNAKSNPTKPRMPCLNNSTSDSRLYNDEPRLPVKCPRRNAANIARPIRRESVDIPILSPGCRDAVRRRLCARSARRECEPNRARHASLRHVGLHSLVVLPKFRRGTLHAQFLLLWVEVEASGMGCRRSNASERPSASPWRGDHRPASRESISDKRKEVPKEGHLKGIRHE
jgi:hypothetical protein